MTVRLRSLLILLVFWLAGCSSATLTPPPAALTVAAQLGTEAPERPTREQVIVPPAQQTQDALATRILNEQTREAQARLRQTQTGSVPTPTFTPVPPTWTPPAVVTPWWTLTPEPTGTATPQPPLQAHTFELSPLVLAQEVSGGPFGNAHPPPDVVLYGDGLLIRSNLDYSFNYNPVGRKLERAEMCALLNSLDQTGFLDLPPQEIISPARNQAARIVIWRANAWKSTTVKAEYIDLWEGNRIDTAFLAECSHAMRFGSPAPDNFYCYLPPPTYPQALLDAYALLYYYDPGGLQPVEPEQLVMWVHGPVSDPGDEWPLAHPSLEEVYQWAGGAEAGFEHEPIVIRDPEWVELFSEQVGSRVYQSGPLRLQIYIRPLLPYEDPEQDFAILPPEDLLPPGQTLSCSPEDGQVAVRPDS